MKKKPNRKLLVRKLDKAVSEFVRERDKVCVQCGSDLQLGNGHIFTRTNYSTRWDISIDGNCHCQCWKCNFFHSQRDNWKYYSWYIDKFGQEKFDILYQRHNQVAKITTYELEIKLEEIKNGKRKND